MAFFYDAINGGTSGVKINGRDVALVGNKLGTIDVDVSAEGGFETFEIVPGGNDAGDTLSIFSLRVELMFAGDTDVKFISKDEDDNTITVDGGNWS